MKGQCLCGKITFSVNPVSLDVTACHCKICRR
ncbi:GFA family protein [Acinetobacter nectaris]